VSYLQVAPGVLGSTASDLTGIGSALAQAHAAAALPATSVVSAAEEEVSAAIAALFSNHARAYQALSAQAAAFHDQFVQALTASARSYASAEAANAAAFTANPAQTIQQDLLSLINAPSLALTGRARIANGANGSPGTGQNGAPGGWTAMDTQTNTGPKKSLAFTRPPSRAAAHLRATASHHRLPRRGLARCPLACLPIE
jgi:hypothetical protein